MYLILVLDTSNFIFKNKPQSVNKQQADQIKSSIRQTKQNYQLFRALDL